MKTPIWNLRSGEDRRFRSGHPWVFSNELQSVPKTHPPGELVELRDPGGEFLALGYGNPHSLIAFRALSRKPEVNPLTSAALVQKIQESSNVRRQMGLNSISHRVCFGEADDLAGLIIDRYRLKSGDQVLVLQAHTAGMDRLEAQWLEILRTWIESEGEDWNQVGVILKNNLEIRKLEGLDVHPPKVLKSIPNLEHAEIIVAGVRPEKTVSFFVDLIEGQKTGFFLDQRNNLWQISEFLKRYDFGDKKAVRVLDLFSYVGQWSRVLGEVLSSKGLSPELTLIDSSQKALDFAKENLKTIAKEVRLLRMDVIENLKQLESERFDVIVVDPPALIKGRKNLAVGQKAYLELNARALRLLAPKGVLVSCSCSGLLSEGDFEGVLARAVKKSQTSVRWVRHGLQAEDHPIRMHFPEGQYLKMWLGISS